MIDWIKNNWKIIVGIAVAAFIIQWVLSGGEEGAPVVEEVPVEVVPEVETIEEVVPEILEPEVTPTEEVPVEEILQ